MARAVLVLFALLLAAAACTSETPICADRTRCDPGYCAKDPSCVEPVVTWSERLTQPGAIALAILGAVFAGARARRREARKRQFGIHED